MTAQIGFERIIIDSSGWIQYIGGGPKSSQFAPYVESQTAELLMPSVVAYEVYKILVRDAPHSVADQFLSKAYAFDKRLIPFSLEIAFRAAKTSLDMKLAMADAIIYATARHHDAQLITSDEHFNNLPHVRFI